MSKTLKRPEELTMQHAKLSPSAAKIWMECSGMPSLASKVPYRTSLPAASGTLIHSMTEMLLKDRLENTTLSEYWLGRTECIDDYEITVDEDMISCAEVYVDYVNRRQKELGAKKKLIEEKVSVNEISQHLWGTADCILINEKFIEVIDLKSGKYPVDVERNPQLFIYALGALARYGNEDMTVIMTIVQPRGWHKDGKIRSYEISAPNLVDWGFNTLQAATTACEEPNPQFNPSKETCRWCPAKDICDSYKNLFGDKI